jgi:hypothetical protein
MNTWDSVMLGQQVGDISGVFCSLDGSEKLTASA